MSNYLPDPDFEEKLGDALFTPDPSDQFISRLHIKLNAKAVDLKADRRSAPFKKLRVILSVSLILMVMILIILDSPQLVEAVRQIINYIPGIGLVTNDGSLRVLAEPVSQTLSGITVSVNEAVVSPEKTIIVYTVENIPAGKLFPADGLVCTTAAQIHLPDGTILPSGAGGGEGWGTGYERRFSYPSVPVGVESITLVLPCIQDTTLGALPENWELPLRFVPAPAELKAVPLTEPTSTPTTSFQTENAVQNPLSVTGVVDAGDSYILIGEFLPPAPKQDGEWFSQGSVVKLTDADGREVPFEFPQDIDLPLPSSSNTEVWAVKLSKEFTSPISIKYANQYILPAYPVEPYKFIFDAGQNPLAGQVWELNKEIRWSGFTFWLVSITALQNGYNFTFAAKDEAINSFLINFEGYTPTGGGGGGGGGSDPERTWSMGVNFAGMPEGKLKVIFSNLLISSEIKNWALEWQP